MFPHFEYAVFSGRTNAFFLEYETEIKEDKSFKLHFKVGKGLKIFHQSKYLEMHLFQFASP